MRHKRISNELKNSIAPDIANAKRKSKGVLTYGNHRTG